MDRQQRGVLYPERLPEFHRLLPAPEFSYAVNWFWIPEWNLPEGVESRQELLPFPACNVVVETSGAFLVGPPSRRSERVLTGSGWAVAALLRPAAATLIPDPAALRDSMQQLDEPGLLRTIAAAMTDPDAAPADRRSDAVRTLGQWIARRVPAPRAGSSGALANELETVLADPGITRVDELAPRLHTSVRTLQRVAERYFGLPLHAMIRRRRLQEAAQRLREDRSVTVSQLAVELGYADHAHFTTDFTALLGVPPSSYRERSELS